MDVSRLGHTLDMLVDYLDRHLRKHATVSNIVITSRQGEGVGQAVLRFNLPDGAPRRIELRELAWADVRPSLGDASLWVRLFRGTILLRYWIGAWVFRRVPTTSASMRRSTALSCTSLGFWYLLVLAAAAHLLITEFDLLPFLKSAEPTTWISKLVWLAILAVLGSEAMHQGLNHSWGTYCFMTDQDSFRRKTRTRLLGMLTHIAEEQRPVGRILILAHSMGTAIAVDALDAGQAMQDELPAVDLVTLGSPLEFLALREPAMTATVERCLRSKLVRRWQDYFDLTDAYCSRVPVPAAAQAADDGKFAAHQVTLRRPLNEAWGMRDKHNAYLQLQAVLDLIAGIPAAAPAPTSQPSAGPAAHMR